MNKGHIHKLTVLDLFNNLVIKNEETPDKVIIFDRENSFAHVILTKLDILDISEFIRNKNNSRYKLVGHFEIRMDNGWLLIKNYKKLEVSILKENFYVIAEFLKERGIFSNE